MNLHEYQAKDLIKKYGVPVQEGIVAETVDQAVAAAEKLTQQTGTKVWGAKAQIHARRRGKGGGVKVATNMDKLKQRSKDILGMQLVTPQTGPQGKKVNKVLIAQDVYDGDEKTRKEFYVSILSDRTRKCNVIVY